MEPGAVRRDAEPLRETFEDDERRIALAGAPLVPVERVACPVPEPRVRGHGVVGDLGEIRREFGARAAHQRALFAFTVVRRAEHFGERARVAELGLAIVVEPMLCLVTPDPARYQLVDASVDPR